MLIIFTVGQLFCGAAGLTSASRTWYAFSRDRGMPGWSLFRRLNRQARAALRRARRVGRVADHHDPGLLRQQGRGPVGVLRDHRDLHGRPVPRLHHPGVPAAAARATSSRPARGRSGARYKWVNIGAIAFVVLVVYSLDIPTTFNGVPWNRGFTSTAVNYSPLVLLVGMIVGDLVAARCQEQVQGAGTDDRRS